MEDNDLPDFDADDLLAAMAEELRKEELAKLGLSRGEAAQEEGEGVSAVAEDGRYDPVGDVVQGSLECEGECAG